VAKQSGQKFIGRNRAPRVQIEYDVEVYGSQKKIQLPFVMGVMADLSGRPAEPLPSVDERKFLEIDVDNFDSRLKAMKPRVAFHVPNTLTGQGNLSVDITFESMDDFSPAAVARRVEPLRKLLEARTQLANLMTWMDGKSGAENLIANLLQDPALLQTLTSAPKPAAPQAVAGESSVGSSAASSSESGLTGGEPSDAPSPDEDITP
jgi:type VI secretion system protein ImpB